MGHVTLTRMSDKVLQKELITKVKSTGKEALMKEALTQEAYRNLDISNGRQKANRVPVRPSSQRSSRENSRERGREFFSCGQTGHIARDCRNPQKWCSNFKANSHSTDQCRKNRQDDEVSVVNVVNRTSGQANNERQKSRNR